LGDAEARALVDRFIDAWERGDVDGLVALLAADVELTMPPIASWFRGRSAVESFLRRRPLGPARRWRGVPGGANGQPAVALYLEQDGAFVAHGLCVLTVRGREVTGITTFLDPDLFAAFD